MTECLSVSLSYFSALQMPFTVLPFRTYKSKQVLHIYSFIPQFLFVSITNHHTQKVFFFAISFNEWCLLLTRRIQILCGCAFCFKIFLKMSPYFHRSIIITSILDERLYLKFPNSCFFNSKLDFLILLLIFGCVTLEASSCCLLSRVSR